MKLGILVDNLGPSQMAYSLISRANKVVTEEPSKCITVFYETLALPCIPLSFAQMNAAEVYGLNWPIIATNLSTAQKLLKITGPTRRLFYVWDLEWLRIQQKDFRSLYNVYGDQRLQLITRGDSHRIAIRNAWGRDSAIVEDFDMAKLYELAMAS
jgi:hypothetical protein